MARPDGNYPLIVAVCRPLSRTPSRTSVGRPDWPPARAGSKVQNREARPMRSDKRFP